MPRKSYKIQEALQQRKQNEAAALDLSLIHISMGWMVETSFVSTSPALLRRIFPRAAALGAAAITGCLRRALFSLGTACVICGGDTAFSPSPDHPAPFSPLHFF